MKKLIESFLLLRCDEPFYNVAQFLVTRLFSQTHIEEHCKIITSIFKIPVTLNCTCLERPRRRRGKKSVFWLDGISYCWGIQINLSVYDKTYLEEEKLDQWGERWTKLLLIKLTSLLIHEYKHIEQLQAGVERSREDLEREAQEEEIMFILRSSELDFDEASSLFPTTTTASASIAPSNISNATNIPQTGISI